MVRMAALIHDVTHVPFGHNVEDQTGLLPRHDSRYRYERRLGAHTSLGRVLDELGLREDVLAVLAPVEGGGAVPAYWHQIMSDTICSDIIDYLARDAYFTGLRLSIDDRLTSYFKVDRASGNLYIDLAKRALLREDILSEIVRMLEARYYFSERVYYHHAKVSAGALVARAVELSLSAGLLEEGDVYDQTDASLLDTLDRRAAEGEPELAERVRRLVRRFAERKLLKRACVFPRYANAEVQEDLVQRFFTQQGRQERLAVEERVSDLVHFATGQRVEVIVYCPAAAMQLKEVATHVRWPGHDEVLPLAHFADRVPRLADLERAYRDLWKFYVFADTTDTALLRKVQEVALEEFPGATNVYEIVDER